MEENFDLLAQSRANYFVKGSPVQFVKVELLKGDVSGDVAVCLSFKNITSKALSSLTIGFKCKGRNGAVLCQDNFVYDGLNTADGELFGSDDAVYISSTPIGSVEVDLKQIMFTDGTVHRLEGYNRVRLPALKKLSPQLAAQLSERTQKSGLAYQPQVLTDGWYCACGAFHPREEKGVWCSECGADRVLLQNTLSSLLQTGSPAPATDTQPTRMASFQVDEPTRAVPPINPAPQRIAEAEGMYDDDDGDVLLAPSWHNERPAPQQTPYNAAPRRSETRRKDPRDEMAEKIIRWAPIITGVLCIGIVIVGFIIA